MARQSPVTVGLLLGALSGVLAALVGSTPVVNRFERTIYDQMAHWFAEPDLARSSRVKLALLTDEDLRRWRMQQDSALGSYPFPREVWGTFIELLAEKRPAAIVLDVLFADPSIHGVDDDAALADAMRRARCVILPASVERSADDSAPRPGLPETARIVLYGRDELLFRPESLVLPIDALAGSARRLGIAMITSEDDVIRRIPVAFQLDDGIAASFPVATCMEVFGESSLQLESGRLLKRFAGIDVPLDGDGQLLLNYRGPRGSFSTTTLASLGTALEMGETDDPWLDELDKGDIVILGVSVAGNPDVHDTPTGRNMPGPEIIATAIDNLIRGDSRARPHRAVLRFLAVLLGVLVGIASTLSSRRRIALLFALPITLAYLGAGVWLFRTGLVLDFVTPVGAAFLAYLGAAIWLFETEGKKRREIRAMFSRCLSADVVGELEARPESLTPGGERRVLTVFFSDISGFTSISEQMEPEQLVRFLNDYLTFMTNTILDTRGLIDKYEGDAIMAFWGAPLPLDDHARRALEAAARCQEQLEEFSASRSEEGLPPLSTRMGLNTGPMVVGYMGSERRLDFTVIGDAVNLASRLEGANKQFGSDILLTQATLDAANGSPGKAVITRPLGNVRVKGKEQPVRVHELLGAGGAGLTSLPEWAECFIAGQALFEEGRFQEARERFTRADRARPGGDPVARRFLQFCVEQDDEKADGFDGIITLTEK